MIDSLRFVIFHLRLIFSAFLHNPLTKNANQLFTAQNNTEFY